MTDNDNPFDDTPWDWPRCPVRGNPYEDDGWCWWPRYYLWLPEGFYCPEHTDFIKNGHRTGYFKDWPRDMSPEVLEFYEAAATFVSCDSKEGERLLREVEAEARKAGFRVAYAHTDKEAPL